MKYFNYFCKKIRENFDNVVVINEHKIEFNNGLCFYFDFKDLEKAVVGNANYKQEIYKTIQEIKAMCNENIDLGELRTLIKLRSSLAGIYKSIEVISFDEVDTVAFTNMQNETIVRSFPKDMLKSDLFYNNMLDIVIEEMRTPVQSEGEVINEGNNIEANI
jgi:hypothetical protein